MHKHRHLFPKLLALVVLLAIPFTLLASSSVNRLASNAYDSSRPGDANMDGVVNLSDYLIVFENYAKTPLTDSRADMNADGKVNIQDYALLFDNFGKTYTIPTPTGVISPTTLTSIEGVPVCTDHNPTKWHALVKKNPDGSINCTYGHEHHDDPNSVTDIFGKPGSWYGGSQEISYPWQTFKFTTPVGVNYPMPTPPPNPNDMENALKHNGYKWYVKRDLPCIPFWAAPNDGCFKAFRVEVHSLGTTADSTVRFHSFSMEAQVDYHGKIGIIRGGGWMDTGFLGALVDGGNATICPPTTTLFNTNPPTFTCKGSGTHREVYSTNVPSPHTAHANPGANVNWYAAHSGGVQAGPQVEDFGPTDYNDPTKQNFYDPKYNANNSRGRLENMSASVASFPYYSLLKQYIAADGTVNFKGYQDRYGSFVFTGCTSPSVDCVPFQAENATTAGHSLMNANTNPTVFGFPNHDVMSPVTGGSLIVFPN